MKKKIITQSLQDNYTKVFEFNISDKNFITISRKDDYFKKQKSIDVFANNFFWGFVKAKHANKIKINLCDNQSLTLNKSFGILIPPYTPMEWEIAPGELEWHAFFIEQNSLDYNLENPVLFDWDEQLPTSNQNLLNHYEKSETNISIIQNNYQSIVAKKLKLKIDQTFQNKIKISELAKDLKFPRTLMAREFKKTYGLSPVEYRNRLRITEGLRLINQNFFSVTEAAYESGFSNLNRFEQNFKQLMGHNPKKFKRSK